VIASRLLDHDQGVLQMRSLWRKAVLALAVGFATAAAPAAASVPIGQVATMSPGACGENFDATQMSVAAGTGYTVPSTGGIASWTVTSWSTRAGSAAGQMLTMKIFRQVAGLTYSVVGHDGPRLLAPGVDNSFATSPGFSVKPGDVLGLHTDSDDIDCVDNTGQTGDVQLFLNDSNLADGQSGLFDTFATQRLNVAAVLDPTNQFTRARTRRNKKRGIAILTLRVPNPGELVASGKGVKRVSKTVASPGDVTLKIAAKGKKRRKLNDTGKAKLSPTLAFTPTGGVPSTQVAKVKLLQR
jgi:hypothetical protein